MTFEDLKNDVLQWGLDRNLIVPQNQLKQALKMVPEIATLCDAIIKNDEEKQIDGIGDVLVTVIILSEQLGYDPVKCLELAYNEIKNRTGKTINGTFIKD
jgi:NTP pyrophosphatase (non-canonical NTP hydrolase)